MPETVLADALDEEGLVRPNVDWRIPQRMVGRCVERAGRKTNILAVDFQFHFAPRSISEVKFRSLPKERTSYGFRHDKAC